MDKTDIAKEWLSIAGMDLASAEYLQTMQPKPIEIICYHCQQSAEKYLKGFLAFHGKEIVKTHDLIWLNRECKKIEEEFQNLEEDCLYLTDFGVNVRYPFPLDVSDLDMIKSINSATNIKKYVVSKLEIE